MGSTRLFISGLSTTTEEKLIRNAIEEYATIRLLEVKEKKDIVSGEVIKKFAFATLDGSPDLIESCVQSLNGSVLDGQEISVGRAKENIIDKIRREKQEKLEPVAVEADIPVFNKPYQYPTPREQSKPNRDRPQNVGITPADLWKQAVVCATEEEESESYTATSPAKQDNLSYQDEENKNAKKQVSFGGKSSEKEPVKTVVDSRLKFTSASKEFSIFDTISAAGMNLDNIREDTTEEAEQESPNLIKIDSPVIKVSKFVAKKKFFWTIDDPRVAENLHWIYSKSDDKVHDEYMNKIRPEVTKAYKGKHYKAKHREDQSNKYRDENGNPLLVSDVLLRFNKDL